MLLKNNLSRDAEHLLLLNDNLLSDSSLISSIKVMSNSNQRSKNWIWVIYQLACIFIFFIL